MGVKVLNGAVSDGTHFYCAPHAAGIWHGITQPPSKAITIILVCPGTHHVAEGGFELVVLLLLLSQCRDYRRELPHSFFRCWGLIEGLHAWAVSVCPPRYSPQPPLMVMSFSLFPCCP